MQIGAKRHAHVGWCCAVLVQRNAGRKGYIYNLPCAIAFVEVVWLTVIGDKQIQFAVVVEVRPDCCEPVAALWITNAGLHRDISESSVSVVVVHAVGSSLKSAGTALNRNAYVLAGIGGSESAFA